MSNILIITDGKKGTENQCIGLAESLEKKYNLIRIKPMFWVNHLPSIFWTIPLGKIPLILLFGNFKILSYKWPKIIIASGKASVGISIIIKKYQKNKTLVIQLQDPRVNSKFFDLVCSPKHDNTSGDNVIKTYGALNRINDSTLSLAREKFFSKFNNLNKPIIAVLIGGKNKHFKINIKKIIKLAKLLNKLQEDNNVTLLISFSRRTKIDTKKSFVSALNLKNVIIWDEKGENPYIGFLAFADYFIVTEDSISMVSESASTGKPVYIFQLNGKSKKFEKFYRQLYSENITRVFTGKIDEPWQYKKLEDTSHVALYLKQNYSDFLSEN